MSAAGFEVYLIDDDQRVLSALRRLLSAEGYAVRTYSDAETFLAEHDPATPGCAIVDLGLPGLDGFEIQKALSSEAGDRPVVFLTGTGDIPASVKAMKAGAVDFLVKPVDATTLLAAVQQAERTDAEIRGRWTERHSFEERVSRLTPRELQVMDAVVAGRLNKQIAGDLGTVEKTIKVHRSRMMAKMGVRTLADLVRMVQQFRA
jgi:FixJ family two-component response regulator